jgi:ligand-binding SRPBCC domain-containing protein
MQEIGWMSIYTLRREQFIARPVADVFPFFSNTANLQQITPAFLDFTILTPQPVEIRRGTILDYRIRWYFIRILWRTMIVEWKPPHGFVDVQIKGPYKLWRHAHAFEESQGGTRMVDSVSYELPLGILGDIAHSLKVRSDLERIFDYRRDRIQEIFAG